MNVPMHARLTTSLFVLAALGCASSHKEEKLATQDVPAPVMHAVNARLPGAQVKSVEREKEHGNIVYDFELTHQGRKYEMDVKDDGTLLEIEKEIQIADVPRAVANAVHEKWPSATIHEVMEVSVVKGGEEKPMRYEVTLTTADKKKMEVNVAIDGSKVDEEEGDED